MSKTKFLPENAIAAACLCWPLLAAEQKKGAEELVNPPPQPYSERETKADRFQRLGHPEKASSLIGMQVQNLQNEKLGKVDDLAVDLE